MGLGQSRSRPAITQFRGDFAKVLLLFRDSIRQKIEAFEKSFGIIASGYNFISAI